MDTQAQMQAIVAKLVGDTTGPLPPLAQLDEPWRTIYRRVKRAGDFTEAEMMLHRAAQDIEDGRWLARDIVDLLPPHHAFSTFRSLHEMQSRFADVRWLWPGWIPRGMVTLLGAAPGMGKSLVALDLARRILAGEPFPDGATLNCPDRRVLIVDAEGAPTLLNQRARAWDLDRQRLYLLLAPEPAGLIDLSAPPHQELLQEMCYDLQPALVVVDSLAAAASRGETSIEGARAILGFLSSVARQYDLALLVIHHLRKRAGGSRVHFRPAADDLRGSSHLSAAARSVLALSLAGTDATGLELPDLNGPRRLEVVKTNLCRLPLPLGLVFEDVDLPVPTLRYSEALPYAAPPTQTRLCARWLLEYLSAAGEPVKPAAVVHAAAESGFSRFTLYRARRTLADAIVDLGKSTHDPHKRWVLAESAKHRSPDAATDRPMTPPDSTLRSSKTVT